MRTNRRNSKSRSLVDGTTIVGRIALLVLCCSQLSLAEQLQPRTFASPTQASQALYEAVKNNDEPAIHAVLGAGPELISSGSPSEDKLDRERFTRKYQQMHRLVQEADGATVLYIGAENWPFPVPLMSTKGRWYFDPEAGTQEIFARRIGKNETIALQVCQTVVSASRNEMDPTSDDPVSDYAQHLVAAGVATGAAIPERELFHGYYFRVVPEKLGGAELVAYPAEYRVSGVTTFLVTPDGLVYEKDLGPQTPTLAEQVHGKLTGNWAAVQAGPDK